MRNPQETKNLLLVSKYVLNHFNLTNESMKLFKYRVTQENLVAPEYKKLIGSSPDLRARFKMSSSELESMDEGWRIFKTRYPSFIDTYGVQYKHYYNGKVLVRKNEVKLLKLLVEYYTSEPKFLSIFIQDEGVPTTFVEKIKLAMVQKIKEVYSDAVPIGSRPVFINHYYYDYFEDKYVISFSLNAMRNYDEIGENITLTSDEIINPEEYVDQVRSIVKESLDFIGRKALPKKDLELVISHNPADIFMASTSEKWGSCINVDSDYQEAYWAGLPGAIVDKNRAILYITDGKKKEYKGIIVDRMLTRTFLLTARDKQTNETFISLVRSYPLEINFEPMLESISKEHNLKFIRSFLSDNCVSRYYFEAMYHNLNMDYDKFCYFYLDNSSVKFARANKTKYFPMEYCYHKFSGGVGYPDIIVQRPYWRRNRKYGAEAYFDCDYGLSGLIENRDEIRVPERIMEEIRYA